MTWVDRFDPVSNSTPNCERVPAHHSKLCISAHYKLSTTPATPEIMNRDSKGWEMGGASTHFSRRYVSFAISTLILH